MICIHGCHRGITGVDGNPLKEFNEGDDDDEVADDDSESDYASISADDNELYEIW